MCTGLHIYDGFLDRWQITLIDMMKNFGSVPRSKTAHTVRQHRIDNMLGNCQGGCSCRRWHITDMHEAFGVNEMEVIDQLTVYAQGLGSYARSAWNEIVICKLWQQAL